MPPSAPFVIPICSKCIPCDKDFARRIAWRIKNRVDSQTVANAARVYSTRALLASAFNYFIIALDLFPVVFFTPPEEAIGKGYFFAARGGELNREASLRARGCAAKLFAANTAATVADSFFAWIKTASARRSPLIYFAVVMPRQRAMKTNAMRQTRTNKPPKLNAASINPSTMTARPSIRA